MNQSYRLSSHSTPEYADFSKLDHGALTPMMQQYAALKKENPETLLFYRLGDFYELFFDDALIVSTALKLALTKRGVAGDKPIPMCGVPYHSADQYIAKLIDEGFKIAVCEQTETPEEAKKRTGKSTALVNREVKRMLSPGTLIEENYIKQDDAQYLATISAHLSAKTPHIVMAWLDITTEKFWFQVTPIKGQYQSVVEDFLARIQPKELVLCRDGVYPQLKRIAEAKDVFISSAADYQRVDFKKSCEEFYQTKDLSFIFDGMPVSSSVGEAQNSTDQIMQNNVYRAVFVLLQFVKDMHKDNPITIAVPKSKQQQNMMYLDQHSIKHLEIFYASDGKTKNSLFDVLNQTKSAMGSRLLSSFLRYPSYDITQINARHDSIAFFKENGSVTKRVIQNLMHTPDMERALARIHMKAGSPRDLGSLKDGLNVFIQLTQILGLDFKSEGDARPTKGLLPDMITPAKEWHHKKAYEAVIDIYERIQSALTEPYAPHLLQPGYIADGFCDELDQKRDFLKNTKMHIASLEQECRHHTQIQSLKIKHNNMLGYYIETNKKDGEKLVSPAFKEHYYHRQTMANNMRFTCEKLQVIEEKIMNVGTEISTIERQIWLDLCHDVLKTATYLKKIAQWIGHIDVFANHAHMAAQQKYTRPTMHAQNSPNSRVLNIQNGRHPVVEKLLFKQRQYFTANHAILCDHTTQNDQHLLVMTGPNMGGKSTYLRQNALIVLMAQAGLFVSADHAEIGVVDRIFSRVGASDHLAQGLSTFMVEMTETASIMHHATAQSLVILDELGRGTSTFDGLSIAWSALEYFDQLGSRTFFATHYHELIELVKRQNSMRAMTVDVRENKGGIEFLYKVKPGQAKNSYGIQVAKLAGLPSHVIKRAQHILSLIENTKLEDILRDLSDDYMPLFASQNHDDDSIDSENEKAIEEADNIVSIPSSDEEVPQGGRGLIIEKLSAANIDDMSPREAQALLFDLKDLLKGDRNQQSA